MEEYRKGDKSNKVYVKKKKRNIIYCLLCMACVKRLNR